LYLLCNNKITVLIDPTVLSAEDPLGGHTSSVDADRSCWQNALDFQRPKARKEWLEV